MEGVFLTLISVLGLMLLGLLLEYPLCRRTLLQLGAVLLDP